MKNGAMNAEQYINIVSDKNLPINIGINSLLFSDAILSDSIISGSRDIMIFTISLIIVDNVALTAGLILSIVKLI